MQTEAPTRLGGESEFERLRQLLGMQRRVLGLVATGAPPQRVFDSLCVEVESLVPGAVCTVMTLEGSRLRIAAAPSAPPGIREGADGVHVGEGSCGVAVETGRPVIVTDTGVDERWREFRAFAEELGIGACWSIPIVSRDRGIRGTFALYFEGHVSPDEVQSQILESASSMAAITMERADAARSLARAETMYRTVFESVNDAIFIHDLETGEIVDVNPRMCEMFGYTRDEAVALTIGDLSAGDGFNEAEGRRRIRLAASGSAQIFEWNSRRSDGSTFWVEVNLKRAVIDGEDRVLAVVRDVSQRKAAESALRESEATLRAIMDSTPDYVMLLDLDGAIRFINRVSEGYELSDVLGRSVFDFVDESYVGVMRACFARVIASGEIDGYEVEHAGPDGVRRMYESRVSPIVRDGEIVALTVSANDVTERKRAERAIMESEARFRQLTEAIDDVFWLTDWADRRVVYVSPSYERVWGRPCQNLYDDARSWSSVIHPEDLERVTGAFYSQAEAGAYDVEYRIVRPDGELRWIHDKAFPIRDASGTVVRVAGVSEDITERKRAEDEIIRRAQTERILRSELDHRVRNNLASLITLIEMSERNASDLPGFASAIKGRVNAMATIHSFLSRTSWSDVLLREMVDALTPPDARAGVVCEGEPVMVPAYQCNSLAVVLHELMHNSMKHGAMGAPGGRITLSWTTEPLEETGGVRLLLRWRETGGPRIDRDPSPGVGTALIEGLVNWDLGGKVRFRYTPEGPDHAIDVALNPS